MLNAMGYMNAGDIAEAYLAGRPVLHEVGRRGLWHLDHMTTTLGYKAPQR